MNQSNLPNQPAQRRKRGRPPKITAVRDQNLRQMGQTVFRTTVPLSPSPSEPHLPPTGISEDGADSEAQELPPLQPDKPPLSQSRQRAPRAAKGKADIVHDFVYEGHALVGVGLSLVDTYDGQIWTARTPVMTDALIAYAQQQKEVYRVLYWLATRSSAFYLFMAYFGTLAPIAVHHQLLPRLIAQRLGMQVPEPERPQPTTQTEQEAVFAALRAETGAMAGFSPEQQAEIFRQAQERFAAVQMASDAGASRGAGASFNPVDTEPHPEQNPAVLSQLLERRG